MSNRLAVYISSFDGCSDLWKSFFLVFDKYWFDCQYPLYLINNVKKFDYKGLNIINTGEEINWFYRNILALEGMQEKYILFMLEDYFISKKVDNLDVEEIINFMDDNNVFYYQLSPGNMKTKQPVRVSVKADIEYPVSLQLAIWKRDVLIRILKNIGGSTPWDVENYFINKFKNKKGHIKGVYHDTRDLFGYKNAVLRGKWILDTVNFYNKRGINLDLGKREIMSKKQMFKYRVAVFTHKYIPGSVKSIMKKILKIFRMDYLK